MNKLAKKMAKREGFTLVELIVVIAILGILAGIAIPVYSGYIKKANEAADMQLLDSVNTAAQFAVMDNNANGRVTKITVTPGATASIVIEWTDNDADTTDANLTIADVNPYLEGNSFAAFKSGASSAVLDATVDQPRWVLNYT